MVNVTVDARGLACPMPIVKAKKAIDSLKSGEVLELLATDKGSTNDLKAWARNGGHELVQAVEEAGVYRFHIRKA